MSDESTKQKTWMSIEEAAAELEVSPNTVRTYVRKRELRATKVGRGWRITPDDLQQFLVKRSNMGGRAA